MIPKISEITKPFLSMAYTQDSVLVLDAEKQLGKKFKLSKSEMEQEKPSGGERMLLHRIRWAVTYLKKAKLVKAVGRGEVEITTRGKNLLEDPDCPKMITESYLNKFKSFKDTRRNQ